MIKLTNTSKIYIVAPFQFETGGPEALHQLAHKLNLMGYNCLTIYKKEPFDPILHDGTPKSYKKYYLIREGNTIEDNEDNIIIVPEKWTRLLNSFQRIRKCIWWLSVDNNLNSLHGKFDQWSDDILHLFQSNYAKNYVESRGGKGSYLSEYIQRDFMSDTIDTKNREYIVLYNPAKGLEFTKKILRRVKDKYIKCIGLKGYDSRKLKELFNKSRVYIDFGHHPGMDRMPREAVVNGCCVIVGSHGAAKFFEDIPIPEKYRIDSSTSIDDISRNIKECVYNYERQVTDFTDYVEFVKNQELRMQIDIQRIFKKAAISDDFLILEETAESAKTSNRRQELGYDGTHS